MTILLRFVVVPLIIISVCWPSISQAEKVVVIPLSKSAASVEKELYLPANLFRSTTSAMTWSWEEDGTIINPHSAGDWIAPILLPKGTTILSLELIWKNNVSNSGQSRVYLHVLNILSSTGISSLFSSSTNTFEGVQSLIYDNPDLSISENYKLSVKVYFSNAERWLIGVKVIYKE